MQNITDSDFENEVISSKLPVLVDFWAAWCGPCRMVAPEVEKVAGKLEGKLKVVKMNVDENPEKAGLYGIMSIPTLLVFKDGKEVARLIGYQSADELEKKIMSLIP